MVRRPALLLAALAVVAAPDSRADEKDLSGWALRTIARMPWGSGPSHLGRALPSEANPECPMSFAVDENGRAFVLDQVNARVQIIENGAAIGAVPAPGKYFQDLALLPGGRLAVLDRLVRGEVLLIDRAGKRLGSLPIVGPGVPLAAGVSALFFAEGLWVEYDNARGVQLSDAALAAVERRPARSGRFARVESPSFAARRDGRRAVVVGRELPEGGGWMRSIAFSRDVLRILALEPDDEGRVFLVADVVEAAPDGRLVSTSAEVVALDAEGRELRRFQLPPLVGPEEQMRPIRLGADGALYQLRCEAEAAVLRRLGP
ncbi:MAG: hypothetical protein ACOX6T_20565 [Myxococcales bacterium]|jgi:hypothetical protein